MLPEKEEGKKKKFCYLQNNLIYAPCVVTLVRLLLNISASVHKLTKSFPSPPVPSFSIPNLQIILCA